MRGFRSNIRPPAPLNSCPLLFIRHTNCLDNPGSDLGRHGEPASRAKKAKKHNAIGRAEKGDFSPLTPSQARATQFPKVFIYMALQRTNEQFSGLSRPLTPPEPTAIVSPEVTGKSQHITGSRTARFQLLVKLNIAALHLAVARFRRRTKSGAGSCIFGALIS